MFKYLVPVLFFAVAAYVWHYNGTHEGVSVMLLPFLDKIPSLEGDLQAQATWSWRLLVGLGGVMLLVAIGSELSGRKKRDGEE